MFKIYSIALLGFLSLQNGYATDQKEEFPGEAAIRSRLVKQQREIEGLQYLFKSIVKEQIENNSQFSTTPPLSASKIEDISTDLAIV